MNTDTHHSSIAAGVNVNGTFSDKPTSLSAAHSTLKPSNCRRRVPCKGAAYCSTARENILAGMFLRRTTARYFLILPLLYFSGLLTCVGSLSGMLNLHPRPSPGSVYRSHEVFKNLLHDIQSDNSSQIELPAVWKYKRKLKEQKPCLSPAADPYFETTVVHQYLIVEAKGGLYQQRASICNAVALAGLLNATLVIPHLKFHNVWRDPSEFGDIYDEDHFITTLKDHVHVVHELPEDLMERYDFNISNIPNLRVPAWSSASYYLEEVYPILHQQRVVRIAPFANRLAVNLPPHIRYLRCLANFEALKFSLPITTLANTLVQRMTANSSSSGGKYISIHLRFEEDMVAFSCCVYDGDDAEYLDLNLIWKKKLGENFNGKNCVIAPDLNRVNGRCPMTPLEVGMMLRGMGFANTTAIYLASGKLYQSDRILGPLREMFPLLHTKELLATPDELASLQGYSSRLAALDYLVCLFSEVFVMTQGGSFPQFLMAHRKFLYSGHAKTINPDKRKLVVLLHNTSISWKSLKDEMQVMLAESDRKGIMVPRAKKTKKRNSPIFSNPLIECRCIWESQTSTI